MQHNARPPVGPELVLHDENLDKRNEFDKRNDENLDELLPELFNEFDDKLRKMASQVGACLSKTVRDVQRKPAKGRGGVFYPRGMTMVG